MGADGLVATLDLQCSNLITQGGIRLFAATIGGHLWLNNAVIHSADGWAVDAPTMTVAGGIYGRSLAAPDGINLFAAEIGESVELPAATLGTTRTPALRAPGARIRRELILTNAALAGNLSLTHAEITGKLTLASATFDSDTIVDLHHATIGTLDAATLDPPAMLDLRAATILTISDEPGRWPQRIAVDMVTYQTLHPVLPARDRLTWLTRGNHTYHPQPYQHLATHYRHLGHDHDARAVQLARHRHHRRTLRQTGRMWGYVEDVTVGYGYLPARALGWLSAITVALAVVFTITPPQPTHPDSRQFHPAAYALDVILPILNLGQEDAFVPTGNTQWAAWAGTLAG